MRAPAVALAAVFVVGMVSRIAPPLEGTVALAISCLAGAVSTCRGGRRLAATVLLLSSYFFLGTSSRLLAEQILERQPLLRLYDALGEVGFEEPFHLEGTLKAEPALRPRATKLLLNVWRRLEWAGRPGSRGSTPGREPKCSGRAGASTIPFESRRG